MPQQIPVRRAVNGGYRKNPVFHSDYAAGAANRPADTVLPLEDTAPVLNHANGSDTPVKIKVNGSANTPQPEALPAADEPDWKEKAIRLQAEMDNFRKHQARRADDAIAAERERLLTIFLPAVDNLARALAHQEDENDDALRQGVELTHRELLRLLEVEGVTPVETVDHTFNPKWHEAIAVIPADVESGTIVDEVEAGYKLGNKLLRPAKVVVAA